MIRQPALELDFVGGRRRSSLIGWVLLLAGAVLTAVAALDWQAADEDAARWSAKAEHWQEMAKRLGGHHATAVTADSTALRLQAVAAAKAINRLATPWGELVRSLEGSVDESVSLLAISPNAEKGELRLNGEAKDFAALRAYLKRLSETSALSDVRLLGQEVKQNDAQHPILFSIIAAWRQPS